jgi:hypothetical protein
MADSPAAAVKSYAKVILMPPCIFCIPDHEWNIQGGVRMTGSPCAAGDQAAEVHLLLLAYNYGPPQCRGQAQAQPARSHTCFLQRTAEEISLSQKAPWLVEVARGGRIISARAELRPKGRLLYPRQRLTKIVHGGARVAAPPRGAVRAGEHPVLLQRDGPAHAPGAITQ